MNSEIIYAFIDYLDQNNALTSLKAQLNNRTFGNGTDLEAYLNDLLIRKGSLEEAINYAFTWDYTNEGRSFWAKLHSDWKNKIEKNEAIPKRYNSIW